MSEGPPAKRIRRSDLYDDEDDIQESPSSSSDEEVTETTTIKEIQDKIGLVYHFDYDIISNAAGHTTNFAHLQVDGFRQDQHGDDDEGKEAKSRPDEEEFEFRLFSTPKPKALRAPSTAAGDADVVDNAITEKPSSTSTSQKPHITKINIRSPTPEQPSDGRFLKPRPLSYYFTSTPATPSSSTKFTQSALSGPTIHTLSRTPWPGTHLPWRVTHLPSHKTSSPSPLLSSSSSSSHATKKRKPNKKRRIQLRERSRLVDAKAKEKEAHLREKKTRLNRERKVKRREKEKALKVGKGPEV